MVATPWGDADELRDRKLRPGPGKPRGDVTRNQRERLYGATVASVVENGYEATTVADLLALSGISRSAFYAYFRNKEDCLLATFKAIVALAMEQVEQELAKDGTWERRARNAVRRLFEMIVAQPAAARLCFNDVYTAGERGRRAVEQALADFGEAASEAIAHIRGQELPPEVVHGMLGGTQAVVHAHLCHDEEGALPSHADPLLNWAMAYEPPPEKLRRSARRPRLLEAQDPPFAAYSQAEQIIRALAACAAQRGYPAVTIAELAARASISQATFYSHFPDKEHLLVAALDSASAQMLSFVTPTLRRAPDWSNGVRSAMGALCAFGAAEPDLASLVIIEAFAAGPVALEHRDNLSREVRALLEPGLELAPQTQPVVVDAIAGAILSVFYRQLVIGGPQSLPRIASLMTYIALAPFVGAPKAVEIANGDGRFRPIA